MSNIGQGCRPFAYDILCAKSLDIVEMMYREYNDLHQIAPETMREAKEFITLAEKELKL